MNDRLVRIIDQTLRDGLSSYGFLPTETKTELARRLQRAGLDYFEVTRFPLDGNYAQFADAVPLLEALQPLRPAATLAVFGMGTAGASEAMQYSQLFDELHIPCFISDGYGRYALGESWPDAMDRVSQAAKLAAGRGVKLTVGVGTAFGCPIDGTGVLRNLRERIAQVASLGLSTIMIGDTAGQATPERVSSVLATAEEVIPPEVLLRVHFHDTLARGLLNTWQAVQSGVAAVDGSLLGTGGEPHPYFRVPASVHNGNCATEAIVALLADAGIRTHVSAPDLNETARWLAGQISENVPGRSAFAEFVPIGGGNEVPQDADGGAVRYRGS